MSGEVISMTDCRRIFGRQPKIKLPESFLTVQAVLGLGRIGRPLCFRFRPSRAGTGIDLFFEGGLCINLSHYEGIVPPNISAARIWACSFAHRHGFEAIETKGPLRPTEPFRRIQTMTAASRAAAPEEKP